MCVYTQHNNTHYNERGFSRTYTETEFLIKGKMYYNNRTDKCYTFFLSAANIINYKKKSSSFFPINE